MPNALLKRLAKAEKDLAALNGAKPAGGDRFNAKKTPAKSKVFGDPHARRGEDPLTSRGFSYLKLFGALAAQKEGGDPTGDAWEHATVEREVITRMKRAHVGTEMGAKFATNSAWGPLGSEFLSDSQGGESGFAQKMKALTVAGVEGADPDEMRYHAGKAYQSPGRKSSTLSWLDQTLGGSLVPPAEWGELITLLRNQDALLRAGATTIPIGPNGRLAMPRQTAASTGYWLGENTAITQTDVKTGQFTLAAKKCAAYLKLPNELIRFAGPSAEALCRLDLVRTLMLTMDKGLLEGTGSDAGQPLGVINTPGIISVTATTTATDGDTLAPQDVIEMEGQVEENNGVFEGYLMRPTLYSKLKQRRADAVTAADGKGPFVFDMLRGVADGVGGNRLNGYPVTTTPQVSKSRVKGSGTTLTYILGGQISDILIAMFGAIEFAATSQGDTSFQYDQTWIRAILHCDGGIRHPGVIAIIDNLLTA